MRSPAVVRCWMLLLILGGGLLALSFPREPVAVAIPPLGVVAGERETVAGDQEDIETLVELLLTDRGDDLLADLSLQPGYFPLVDTTRPIAPEDPIRGEREATGAFRRIVGAGVRAVPFLLAHLDDRRRTAVEFSIRGLMYQTNVSWGFVPPPGTVPDWYDQRVEVDDLGGRKRPLPLKYVVRVGDLCAVALGHILNRPYALTNDGAYRGTSEHFLALARSTAAEDWDGLTREWHQKLLVADLLAEDDHRRESGCKRLAIYYPETLEPLAVRLLTEDTLRLPEKMFLIGSGLVHLRSRRVDDLVCSLMRSTDEDFVIHHCMGHLTGRGFDQEIADRCRDRMAALHPASESARQYRRQLEERAGWALLHVAADRHDVDWVRRLLREGEELNVPDRLGRTPLHVAVAARDLGVVKALVAGGAALNRADAKGVTPVHLAVQLDAYWIARFLVERGCDVPDVLTAAVSRRADRIGPLLRQDRTRREARTPNGNAPLHLAAMAGDADAVAVLLSHEADPEATNIAMDRPLDLAVRRRHHDVARLLLAAGASLDKGPDCDAVPPLAEAAAVGDLVLVDLLLRSGAAVDARDEKGQTALVRAVAVDYLPIVERLLAAGASSSPSPGAWFTPLSWAISNDSPGVARVLIRAGADVCGRDDRGHTPLEIAVMNGSCRVAEVLIDAGAGVNERDPKRGWTPLHHAADWGQKGVAKLLLRRGAAVDNGRIRDDTPLHAAAAKGRTEVIRLLLAAKAPINKGNLKDWDTPLHLAVKGGHAAAVQLLLKNGADPLQPNACLQTSLDLARRLGNKKVNGIVEQYCPSRSE